ncbi:unnamed protein product [Meloidogyne enterolobii]|uniref:Uncharacterized protein n=1 Tax=Meloidogyne enterolobii TaxID=390850 RepID=A0ACB0XQ47_MELEN
MLKNKTTVNAFHSSHSAGIAGKGINTSTPTTTTQSAPKPRGAPPVHEASYLQRGDQRTVEAPISSQSAPKPRGAPPVHEASYLQRGDHRTVETPTTQSAPKPRVVPPQTSTQQTPRAPVVHPQTARPSGAAGVQSSNSMGRVKKGPPSDPRLQSASKPRGTPSVHEATYLQRGDQRTVEISSSSTSKKRQHERLPPMDNNVIRQQEVTAQSPPFKRQNQPQQRQPEQLLPTPTIQQKIVGGGQQQREEEAVCQQSLTSQQNNGEIFKFVQIISEQNDLIKEINHHYQIVVPEKMKMISEITEKLAKFAEAVKTRI